jgi:hypothetical protein
LAVFAFVIADSPVGSRMPRLDWPVFALGVLLVLGAVCIVALGYRRTTERVASAVPRPEPGTAMRTSNDAGEEVRVTRV